MSLHMETYGSKFSLINDGSLEIDNVQEDFVVIVFIKNNIEGGEKMIGERFQSLTVLKLDEETNKRLKDERNNGLRNNAPIHYICRCDCGNILSLAKNNIKKRKINYCPACSLSYLNEYIGKTFEKWKVLSIVYKNEKPYFNCVCECGSIKYVNVYNIINGKSKDCGCGRITYLKSQSKDLTGLKFGKLTVVENMNVKKNGKFLYKCLCDCGKYCYVRSSSLTTNHTTSCGCTNSNYNNIIGEILNKLGYQYKTEFYVNLKKYIDNVSFIRFDVYVEELNLAIEYDGEFHFMPIPFLNEENGIKELERTQYRDGVKNQYCKDNNINLLRIPYTEKDNIENIIINTINKITCND